MHECIFCDILTKDTNLITNTVLWEDSDFYIVPALGCFVSGYILIVSKKHIYSMSYLTSEEQKKLEVIIENLCNKYMAEYGVEPLVFEHGAAYDCANRSACCVFHAHMHVVPHRFSSLDKMSEALSLSLVNSFELFTQKCNSHSYLFFRDNKANMYIRIFDKDVSPSQIIRKWIANDLGIPHEWDWRVNSFSRNIYRTVIDVGQLLYNANLTVQKKSTNKIYYCSAMDGISIDEIAKEYAYIADVLTSYGMTLVNPFSMDCHTHERNKETAALILYENKNSIEKSDCVLVNFSRANHFYAGCHYEMYTAKRKGKYTIAIIGDSGAENHFYIHSQSDIIVKTFENALELLIANRKTIGDENTIPKDQ